jgi:L-lactate dehydrogenase
MKIAIIGTGSVGKACAMATVMRGCAREIVLLDKNHHLAESVATDMQYGAVLSPRTSIYAGGYDDLHDAALVMITAGVNEKTGGATDRSDPKGRLKLYSANAAIYEDIIPQVVKAAPEAVLLIVSDPPDSLADVARQLAGHDRVISAGTFLDTLRFKFHLAKQFNINPANVTAQVIGEHGTSSVFLWSTAMIGGKPVSEWVSQDSSGLRQQVQDAVKFANITIIEGNDASQYGIGMVCSRLAEIVLRDERAVIPVGSYHKEFGVVFSLPSILGANGVEQAVMPSMSDEEKQALHNSVQVLRETLNR